MTGNVSITLKGSLSAKASKCNGAGSAQGPAFTLSLEPASCSPGELGGWLVATIDSVGDFQALPVASGFRANLIYLHSLDLAPWIVRLTFVESDPIEMPLRGGGMWLQEFPDDDRVVSIELKGQGRIEWLAGGEIV